MISLLAWLLDLLYARARTHTHTHTHKYSWNLLYCSTLAILDLTLPILILDSPYTLFFFLLCSPYTYFSYFTRTEWDPLFSINLCSRFIAAVLLLLYLTFLVLTLLTLLTLKGSALLAHPWVSLHRCRHVRPHQLHLLPGKTLNKPLTECLNKVFIESLNRTLTERRRL